MGIKKVVKIKMTNENIRDRFYCERLERESKGLPEFTYKVMAYEFGAYSRDGKKLAPQACSLWSQKRLPNQTVRCPGCGKTQFERVEAWLNSEIYAKWIGDVLAMNTPKKNK